MKLTVLATFAFGLLFMSTAGAAEKTLTPQQQRMRDCNAQATAKTIKGDERKAYMSTCLKGGDAATTKGVTPQQQKMRECNVKSTEQSLKGDDRKKFMSACLKKAA